MPNGKASLGPIIGATVLAPNLKAATAPYVDYLGYRVLSAGAISADQAAVTQGPATTEPGQERAIDENCVGAVHEVPWLLECWIIQARTEAFWLKMLSAFSSADQPAPKRDCPDSVVI